jgi:hypothetical protein
MSEPTTAYDIFQRYRRLWFLLPVLTLLLLILLIGFGLSGRGVERGLKPLRSTPTRSALDLSGEIVELSFTDLNAAPSAYRNRRLRVTGEYLALAVPNCQSYSGPVFAWALVADGLQLNARNFESILRRAPDGLTLTVEGVWRSYEGPLGCGKNAPRGVAWFLAVERIIEPNPLPAFSGPPRPTTAVILPGQPDFPVIPAPPVAATATPPPPDADSSPTPPPDAGTPSPGATQTRLTPEGTPTAVDATPDFPTITPAVTDTPPGELPPGLGTATPTAVFPPTPGDYPGPIGTPTITPTPEPYGG